MIDLHSNVFIFHFIGRTLMQSHSVTVLRSSLVLSVIYYLHLGTFEPHAGLRCGHASEAHLNPRGREM